MFIHRQLGRGRQANTENVLDSWNMPVVIQRVGQPCLKRCIVGHIPNSRLTQLLIYPIKSLGPVEVKAVELTDTGLRFDRSFALVYTPDRTASSADPPLVRHLTIKKTFALALFRPEIDRSWSTLTISHVGTTPADKLTLPLTPSPFGVLDARTYLLSIFGTSAIGIDMGEEPAIFFSRHLGTSVRLVFIGGDGRREIPGARYARNWLDNISRGLQQEQIPQQVKLADAAPLLVTSTASENDVRQRLPETDRNEDVILRFRPNIHLCVDNLLPPYDEDEWRTLEVRSTKDRQTVTIKCVYPCVRCLSINADLDTGQMTDRERQVYGLLASDRRINEAFPRGSLRSYQARSAMETSSPTLRMLP